MTTKIVANSISYSEIKKGDVIKLQGDNNTYVVFQHGQVYHLVPIDMNHQKHVNMYDIHKPEIQDVFDEKTGKCKIHRDDLIVKLDEEIDDKIY